MTTAPEVVARIEALALTHPAYGCNRIEALLALEGRRVSAITVQKILNDKGLGTRHERWLALERQNAEQAIELTPGAGGVPGEAEPLLSRAACRERAAGPAALRRHLHGRLAQGHRPGLPARRGRHPRLLRLRLPPRQQAAGSRGGGPAQRRPAVLREARPAGRGRADRQWPRVLRHRAAPLRALPGAQRHRAPQDQGPQPADQRLRRALQRHRAGGVLPAGHARRSCSRASRRCRPSSTPGCTTTTTSGRISATATRAGGHGRRSNDLPWETVERFVRQGG